MAKAVFQVPELKQYPEIPEIEPGVMAHSAPFKSKEQFQQALGFPGELVDDWQDKAIDKMGDLLGRYRSLRVYLDSCVKCGSCTDKCHYYLGTKDPKNMLPFARLPVWFTEKIHGKKTIKTKIKYLNLLFLPVFSTVSLSMIRGAIKRIFASGRTEKRVDIINPTSSPLTAEIHEICGSTSTGIKSLTTIGRTY